MQWLLSEDTEVIADVLWSGRDVTSNQFGSIIYLAPWTGANSFCNGANEDGSWNCPASGLGFENNTLVSFPITSGVDIFTDDREGEDESLNLGLNIDHQFGSWNISGDVSYADASGDLRWDRSVASYVDGVNPPAAAGANPTAIARGIRGTASTGDDAVHFIPDAEDPQLMNPANYAIQQNEVSIRDNTDEELALKLDIAYEQEESVISAVKFGGYWRSREKSFVLHQGQSAKGEGRDNPVLATTISDSLVSAPGNFLDGNSSWLTPSDFLFPDNSVVFAGRAQNLQISRNNVASFAAEEEVYAAYLQVDLNGAVADMELSGNAGVRVVHTELDIVGQSQKVDLRLSGAIRVPEFFGPVEDFPFSESYTKFLPSLNLRLDINDELLARFSYSKTLTRPEFTFLAPTFGITNATNFLASNGNPGLLPYLGDNIDLGLEWYFNEASAPHGSDFLQKSG